MRCPFPYANEPACDETIDQTGGGTYWAYFVGWLIGAAILFVIHVVQFVRMCRIRGWSRKLFFTSYLHQVYTISLYNAFTILLRSYDPNNYAGRLPFTLYRLLTDTSVWSAYALVLLCICSWVKILRQISGRKARPVIWGERITLCVTLCFFVSASFSYSYVDREYLVAALIEMFCAAYSLTLSFVAWGNGLPVYCHLARFERDHGNPLPKSLPSSSPSTATTKLNKSNRSLTKKKLKIIVILKLMSIMTFCLMIATILPIYFVVTDFQDQYQHNNNPYPYPTWTFGSLLQGSAFMIIESFASIACLYFFRRFGNDTAVDSVDAKSASDPSKTKPGAHVRMDSGHIMSTNTGLHTKGMPSCELQERISGIVVSDAPTPLLAHHTRASSDYPQQHVYFQTPPSTVRTHVPLHPTHPTPYSRTTSPGASGANTARDYTHTSDVSMDIPPRHPCQPPSPHGAGPTDTSSSSSFNPVNVDHVIVDMKPHTPASSSRSNSNRDSQNSDSSRKPAVNHI